MANRGNHPMLRYTILKWSESPLRIHAPTYVIVFRLILLFFSAQRTPHRIRKKVRHIWLISWHMRMYDKVVHTTWKSRIFIMPRKAFRKVCKFPAFLVFTSWGNRRAKASRHILGISIRLKKKREV